MSKILKKNMMIMLAIINIALFGLFLFSLFLPSGRFFTLGVVMLINNYLISILWLIFFILSLIMLLKLKPRLSLMYGLIANIFLLIFLIYYLILLIISPFQEFGIGILFSISLVIGMLCLNIITGRYREEREEIPNS